MQSRILKVMSRFLALVSVGIFLPVALVGQVGPAAHGTGNDLPSRWDIFLGYSYLAPKGTCRRCGLTGHL